MKTEITESGIVSVSTGVQTWQCNSPEQAAKHLPTWTDEKRDGRASEVIEKGDVSAIADCANDYAKMRRDASYRPTKSWRYVNGEAIQTVGVDSPMVQAVPLADAPAPESPTLVQRAIAGAKRMVGLG